MDNLIPGTELIARGLHWELVNTEHLGQQTLYRLRALGGTMPGQELDLLAPFAKIEPIVRTFRPEHAGQLPWLVDGLTRDQYVHVLNAFSQDNSLEKASRVFASGAPSAAVHQHGHIQDESAEGINAKS